MKTIRIVLGAILVFIGGIWVLQGINVLPGSFMTGEVRWAIYGGISVVLGLVVIGLALRKKAAPPAP